MGIYESAKAISEADAVSGGGGIYARAKALSETTPAPQAPATGVLETEPESKPGIFKGTGESIKAFKAGEIKTGEVVKGLPRATVDVGKSFANTFVPAITNFFKTTGSIIGEGLAYATSKDVREQFKAGNLDILPTVTETTQADLAKATIAAGIETAVYRSFPTIAQKQLATRGGLGAIQGVGFAISEGLANERSPEDIIKSLPAFGVLGGVAGTITPYLLPILKAEVGALPKQIRQVFKGLKRETAPATKAVEEVVEPKIKPKPAPQTRAQAELPPASDRTARQDIVREVVGESRAVPVAESILPVGEGATKVSRLEARMRGNLNKITPEVAEAEGLSTFKVSNDADQIQKALAFATKNQEEAMAVIRGEKTAPKGLLNSSIAHAMETIAEDAADKALVIRLASLRGSRAGQEVSFLRNFDKNSPITKIAEIANERIAVATKKLKGGNTVAKETTKLRTGAQTATEKARLKIAEAQAILKDITC